jgi:hypothetical protein
MGQLQKAHQRLGWKTPAEVAGIKVEGDNKWITLIQKLALIKGLLNDNALLQAMNLPWSHASRKRKARMRELKKSVDAFLLDPFTKSESGGTKDFSSLTPKLFDSLVLLWEESATLSNLTRWLNGLTIVLAILTLILTLTVLGFRI